MLREATRLSHEKKHGHFVLRLRSGESHVLVYSTPRYALPQLQTDRTFFVPFDNLRERKPSRDSPIAYWRLEGSVPPVTAMKDEEAVGWWVRNPGKDAILTSCASPTVIRKHLLLALE